MKTILAIIIISFMMLIIILGCPLIPFVWVLINPSTIIWIWLGIDLFLTILMTYCRMPQLFFENYPDDFD